jgi:hypothetical protein
LIFAVRVKMTLGKFVVDYDDGEIGISVGSVMVKEKANREIMQRISKISM